MTEDNIVEPGSEDPARQTDEGSSTDQGGEDTDFTAFEEDFGDGSDLVKLQKELDEAQEELSRSRAETYNVRQEYGNYVRRSKEEAANRQTAAREDVVEELLPVLDDIEAARAAGELADGPFAAIADKFEEILGGRCGL